MSLVKDLVFLIENEAGSGICSTSDTLEAKFDQVVTAGQFNELMSQLKSHDGFVKWRIAALGARLRHSESMSILKEHCTDPDLGFLSIQILDRVSEGAWDGHYSGDSQTTVALDHLEIGSVEESGLPFALSGLPDSFGVGDVQGGAAAMDARIGTANAYFANLVHHNGTTIHFVPVSDTASKDESLAWLWVTHPEYQAHVIVNLEDRDFAAAITRTMSVWDIGI